MKFSFSRFPVFPSSRLLILSVVATLLITQASAQVVDIPDPNLERAIREELGLSSEVPVTQQEMLRLRKLHAYQRDITDLTGLEYATNLKSVILSFNQIVDFSPLSGLINLELLSLSSNPIVDISPLSNLIHLEALYLAAIDLTDITVLSNLTQLKVLDLQRCVHIRDITPLSNLTQLTRLEITGNRIADITPLANLTQLDELRIEDNQIADFSPLQGLSLSVLTYDNFCLLPSSTPIQERIVARSLPSIVVGWHHSIIPRVSLSGDISRSNPDRYAGIEGANPELVSHHDLFWGNVPFDLSFQKSDPWSKLSGNLPKAIARRERLVAKNSNMLFLVEIRHLGAHPAVNYSEDWFGWVRDINGIPISEAPPEQSWRGYMVNFTLPEVQDVIVGQAISVAQCGLYDGIVFDGWHEGYLMLKPRWGETLASPITFEQEKAALLSILQRIRESVPDDFLILCNSNWQKLPSSAPYINGGFMETGRDLDSGYSNDRLAEIEDTLIWFEENLREPKINCVQGQGISTERPDSPTNKRWMRVFTTMSLTLSDGYALYTTGHYYQDHIWYDFWDADLGQPVGPTAQRYQEDIESLYIREFTNGWAVYNRSGEPQSITLPASAFPVSDRIDSGPSTTHQLPNFDGEIYLKTKNPADVNDDGRINVLDLVHVANNFGKSDPDPNGDGVVNILDLVFVAQHLNQNAAAPSQLALIESIPSTAKEVIAVQRALTELEAIPNKSHSVQIAIELLRHYLSIADPNVQETKLLSNYPNPFNPDTWIPYQLSEESTVTVKIYDVTGSLVRTIQVGHKPAGYYHAREAGYLLGRSKPKSRAGQQWRLLLHPQHRHLHPNPANGYPQVGRRQRSIFQTRQSRYESRLSVLGTESRFIGDLSGQ